MRPRLHVILVAAACLVAACSGSSPESAAPSSTTAAPVSTTTGAPTTSSSTPTTTIAATPWIVALSVLAATCLVAEEIFGRRLLDGNDPERLSLAYRTRFFIQVAFSELIALGAFVATFITGQWWVYWLFLPFASLGLWRAAPTKAHLLREDEQLRAAGCPVSLTGVLRNRQDRR